ncbi:MAG: hypothetical protein MJ071_01360 [Oscillospiraceae bacterium]|nr:hypothetical protein [Oscillospiraceae bacterium]
MDDQRSLEAQLLGDMTYDDPRKKAQPTAESGPAPSAAALLGDMGAAAAPVRPQTRYQELTDEQVAILQQQRMAAGQPPYTPEEIAELKAEFIERQRIQAQEAAMAAQAAQQQAAAAMLLQEPEDYTQPEKKPVHEALPQVDASALLEEPAPEPVARPVFNQEDLEAAKKQAAKRASDSLKEVPQKSEEDQKRARMEMERLRVQQLSDLAQAGFKQSIVLTILGVVAAVCMVVFAGCGYPDGYEPSGFFNLAGTFFTYGGIALALLSVTIVLRVQQLKGFTSFMFILSSILLVIPGVLVLFQKRGAESFTVAAISYVLAIIGCFAVTFIISTSDKINAYYGRKEIMYD